MGKVFLQVKVQEKGISFTFFCIKALQETFWLFFICMHLHFMQSVNDVLLASSWRFYCFVVLANTSNVILPTNLLLLEVRREHWMVEHQQRRLQAAVKPLLARVSL